MADQRFEEQIVEFKEAFSLFDKDGDGTIAIKDLRTVMRSLGRNPTDAELEDITNEVDWDGNGTMDFPELLTVMTRKTCCRIERDDSEEVVLEAFKVFDRDNTGFVNVADFPQIVRNLGENISDAEFNEMMAEVHADTSGNVDYTDFVRVMMSK